MDVTLVSKHVLSAQRESFNWLETMLNQTHVYVSGTVGQFFDQANVGEGGRKAFENLFSHATDGRKCFFSFVDESFTAYEKALTATGHNGVQKTRTKAGAIKTKPAKVAAKAKSN